MAPHALTHPGLTLEKGQAEGRPVDQFQAEECVFADTTLCI